MEARVPQPDLSKARFCQLGQPDLSFLVIFSFFLFFHLLRVSLCTTQPQNVSLKNVSQSATQPQKDGGHGKGGWRPKANVAGQASGQGSVPRLISGKNWLNSVSFKQQSSRLPTWLLLPKEPIQYLLQLLL